MKPRLKIVVAMDSFKGFFTSREAADIVKKQIIQRIPDSIVETFSIGDGGEGTIASLIEANDGIYEYVDVVDPLFNPIKAKVGIINETGYIEIAEASGLSFTKGKNVEFTSTYGTGMLIDYLYKKGIHNIVLALGGSATNDAGMGILEALGAIFTWKSNIKKVTSSNLIDIKDIDISIIKEKYSDLKLNILSDVQNKILGENGATYVFGPQKGILKEQLAFYEEGVKNVVSILSNKTNCDLSKIVGGGAAGGVGAILSALFNANIQMGIEYVLNKIKFDECIKDADYVITGEGCIDSQSSQGKLIQGVASHCLRASVPCIAIGGIVKPGFEKIYELGICAVESTVTYPIDDKSIYDRREYNLTSAVDRIIRFIKI